MPRAVKIRKKQAAAAAPRGRGLGARVTALEKAVVALGKGMAALGKAVTEMSREQTRRAKLDADREAKAARRAKLDADREAKAARQAKEATRQAKEATRRAKREAERAKRDAERAKRDAARAEADRDRLARLETALAKDRRNNENHRRNAARALEDAFAASLPRVMRALGIRIDPRQVRVRLRRGRKRREYDFVAPNGEVVLIGEVKTRFTLADLDQLIAALFHFRRDYPEYAGLKLHGVVAGAVVEADAVEKALEDGFIVLQMDGAEAHPVSQNYQPAAY